ncbi:MAG: glycosyltransferase [Parabacteroides johnsonii]
MIKAGVMLTALIRVIVQSIFGNYKIIHIHGASYNSFKRKKYFIHLAKFFHKKVIYHIHGGGFEEFYNQNKKEVKNVLLKCDTIVVLSDYWKFFFTNEIGCKQVVIIRNIIENPIFQKVQKKDSVLHFVLLGLLGKNKGVYDLLEEIKDHKEFYQHKIKLHLGGNGEVENIQSFIRQHDLSEIVTYEGWVSGQKKQELLSNSDVYILPSYKEGMPLSIIEAMSYKLPIISTLIGSIPELVDSTNGILIPPGDKKSLHCANVKILNNKDKLKQMGLASYQKAQNYFPENIEETLTKLYSSLLNL